jgi:hypothetical protein
MKNSGFFAFFVQLKPNIRNIKKDRKLSFVKKGFSLKKVHKK